jgi:hypothetical protein
MKLETLFKKELKLAIKQGADHNQCNHLAGCIRRIVLTEAEGVAGKKVFEKFMAEKLWNDDSFGQGWLFGSPKTMLNIGLVPSKLAKIRLGINMADWAEYKVIT